MSYELQSTVITRMVEARTPEEAYRVFMASFADGVTKVLAEALRKATDTAAAETKDLSNIDGWTSFIRGIQIQACAGTPSFLPAISYLTSSADQLSVRGGSISIGGSWSF